jgi:hypothetical protein
MSRISDGLLDPRLLKEVGDLGKSDLSQSMKQTASLREGNYFWTQQSKIMLL